MHPLRSVINLRSGGRPFVTKNVFFDQKDVGWTRCIASSKDVLETRMVFKSRAQKIVIIEPSLEGHRADQLAAITKILEEHGIRAEHKTCLWPHIFSRHRILFPTVDGVLLAFLIIAPIRACLTLRTVGIWHRPKGSISGPRLKGIAKRYGAKLIRFLPFCQLISVQNLELEPEIACLVGGWIHQIASLNFFPPAHRPKTKSVLVADLIRQRAQGRAIIIYLGQIALEKGFGFFAELMIAARVQHPEITFVAAGTVNEECDTLVRRFAEEGGLVVNRYLTDGEFLTAIEIADWVWICYRPDNDQNSGIFGLAYNAGAKVIVRRNSFVARMASEAGFPAVSIQFGDAKGALEAIVASYEMIVEKPNEERIKSMREQTAKRLLYYLGCNVRN